MKLRSALLALMLFGAAPAALACGFHGYVPQPSLVDELLASDHIVLARPDPDDRFRYKAIRAVEGGVEDVDIPFLLDTATRRKLMINPGDAVLFAREEAYGPWRRLAYVNGALGPLFEEVARRLPDWELGDDAGRFQLFADQMANPDTTVRRIALRELDAADYSVLRRLHLDTDAATLLADMARPAEIDLIAIRTLLLGLSGDPAAAEALWARVDSHARIGSATTGAAAAAVIEHGGAAALEVLGTRYLADESLPVDVRERIVDALAMHRMSGATELAPEIDATVVAAVAASPALAPAVARQFGARNDWSQLSPVETALRSGLIRTPADLIAVSQYVAFAAEFAGEPGTALQ